MVVMDLICSSISGMNAVVSICARTSEIAPSAPINVDPQHVKLLPEILVSILN
jgi:hypothetical protein